MNALNFDTHTIARRYKAAGFSEEQVEAMVETAREAAALPDLSHLATTTDLLATKTDLKGEIAELRSELKSESAGLRQQIAEAKVQFILSSLAIIGFADGLLFFLLRH